MTRRSLAWMAPLLVTFGCTVGPDFRPPLPPADGPYTRDRATRTAVADETSQRFVDGMDVSATWWRFLGCPALDSVVGRALAANPGLESARATLRRSYDSLQAGYGVFFPQIDAHASASRQLYNPAPGVLPSSTFNLVTLSGTVSYTVDVWGGARRQTEVLRAAVDSQRYALDAARVMLTSNVVNAVVAQAAYRAEIDATRGMLVLLQEQARIASAQAAAGTAPYANVLGIRAQVASTAATLPALEQKIDQAADLLAALTATMPAAWDQPPVRLSDLHVPPDVPLSLPSQLVRQRPDVLIAEEELRAANAGIGVATAAMLPNITLTGGAGVGGSSVGDLFGPGAAFWNVGAGLLAPVFHGGALHYQRRAAIDARDAAAAAYRQSVLAAFEQVADTLAALSHDADAVAAQSEAVETAEEAMRLVQANYQAGLATYVQVIVADVQYLQAKIAQVQATAQRLQDTVALYVALGGGWWRAPDDLHG